MKSSSTLSQNTPTPGIAVPTMRMKALCAGLKFSVMGSLAILIGICWFFAYSLWQVHPTASSFIIYFVIASAAAGFVVYKAFVVDLPFVGFAITIKQAPELFHMIFEVANRVGVSPPKQVFLTDQADVQIRSVQRWGSFGGNSSYLLIGVPLFCYMSRLELKSLLTYHMSFTAPGKSADLVKIHRFVSSWKPVHETLQRSSDPFHLPIKKMDERFFPSLLELYPLLHRQLETRADRWASQVTTPEVTGRSLFRMAVSQSRLRDRFWPMLYEKAKIDGLVPGNVFQQMHEAFLAGAEHADVEYWMKECYDNPGALPHSLRTIKERVNVVGFQIQDLKVINDLRHPLADGEKAFELLGTSLPQILTNFSNRWKLQNHKKWGASAPAMTKNKQALQNP